MDHKEKEERIEKEQQTRKESDMEVGEDATKYGEFVSSYFAWIPLPKQKEKAEELQNMTKKKEKN